MKTNGSKYRIATGKVAIATVTLALSLMGSIQVTAQRVASSVVPFQTEQNKFVLTSFTTRVVEGKAFTMWKVIEPATDCLYLLERSQDNTNFTLLYSKRGTVSPNNTELLHSFVDEAPFAGVSYYRVKRYSQEGLNISETVKVVNEGGRLMIAHSSN